MPEAFALDSRRALCSPGASTSLFHGIELNVNFRFLLFASNLLILILNSISGSNNFISSKSKKSKRKQRDPLEMNGDESK